MNFWDLAGADSRAPALFLGAAADSAATVSYGELAARADRLSAEIDGPRRKQLGLVLCRNSPEAVCAYLAGLRRGDAVMLLDAGTEPSLLQAILDAYRPEWIHRPGGSGTLEGYLPGPGDAPGQLWHRIGTDEVPPHPELALLLSTSGTTGSPKMVRLSHTALAANARSIVEYLAIGPGERAPTTLPFNYSFGLSVLNSHLQAGAALVLTEESLVSRTFWETLALHGATSLAGVPYTYQMLRRLDPERLFPASLRTLTQAGGRLAPPMIEWFRRLSELRGWRFFVMYGQTEAAPRISFVPPERLEAKLGSIGLPIPGGRLSLGPEGELIYEGANVMMGYGLCREDLAKPDELHGRLATGDLARMDSEGFFYLEGRLKRFIKIHGNRINLDDVEHRLEEQLKRPAAVVGEDDLLRVYLAGEGDSTAAAGLLSAAYHLHASTYRIACISAIPHTTSGKKDYAGLPR